jgi:hypothetical protein
LLVLNAGIWEGAPIEEMSEETWNRVLNTNLKAAWAMTKACVPAMKKQRTRRDCSGFFDRRTARRSELFKLRGVERRANQFYESSATELCPKIRVNCVAPGWIETAMVRPVFEDENYKQKVINSIPLKRMATTDDVALSICFLLSDWSRHITGEILNINGGSVLCGVAEIVSGERENTPIVVTSAMSKVTDALLNAFETAKKGEAEEAFDSLEFHFDRHFEVAEKLLDENQQKSFAAEMKFASEELRDLLMRVSRRSLPLAMLERRDCFLR